MGTRSLTIIQNANKNEIAVLYRQYDGCPSGHGKQLSEFLKDIKMVNGIGGETTNIANGEECLAAQIIAHFKTAPGDFYLYPAKTRDIGEDYTYFVYTVPGDTTPHIRIESEIKKRTLFAGNAHEAFEFCNNQE